MTNSMTERELSERFAARGLRPTAQRLLIYRFLLEHPIHPTADAIYSALLPEHPALSRTTVYNALHAMEEAGLIRMLPGEGEERQFDGNPVTHGHFRCRACGRLFDFPLTDGTLETLCPAGFRLAGGDLLLQGQCPDCQAKI